MLNDYSDFLIDILRMFFFKTIYDRDDNEYVVFLDSNLDSVNDIEDKTLFEASENHIHLFDNIKKRNINKIEKIGEAIGELLLDRLKYCFPQKNFYVFVTYELHGSLTVRFHQDWREEQPYFDQSIYLEREKLLSFYG